MSPRNVAREAGKVMSIYFETAALNRFAKTVVELKPCPFEGRVTAEQVKVALGEFLDAWPASIADDV